MGKEAIQLFRRVPLDMMDEWIYVCVLNACSHSGFIQDAREIFDKIPIQFRTEKIYTTMVSMPIFVCIEYIIMNSLFIGRWSLSFISF